MALVLLEANLNLTSLKTFIRYGFKFWVPTPARRLHHYAPLSNSKDTFHLEMSCFWAIAEPGLGLGLSKEKHLQLYRRQYLKALKSHSWILFTKNGTTTNITKQQKQTPPQILIHKSFQNILRNSQKNNKYVENNVDLSNDSMKLQVCVYHSLFSSWLSPILTARKCF